MNRRGVNIAGGVFTTIMIGSLVVAMAVIAFGTLVNEGNTTYNLNANSTELQAFNQFNSTSELTSNMNAAFNSNSTVTGGGGIIGSFDTVFSLGLTISKLASNIPAIYATILTAAADSLGIEQVYVNAIILILIIIVITVFLALLLGRYL